MPDWIPWFQIRPETVSDHTTQTVIPYARTSDHIDLFVIGFDNAVWSTYWHRCAWFPWFQIHPETVFDHTTQTVMPYARTPDHIDLFVIGFDNAVWSTYWQPDAGGWRPWFQIHPETVFDHTTQTVMPYARTPDHIDLFVIGNDDTVWSTYWQAPPHDGSWLDAIGDFFEGAWNVVTTIGGALLDAFDNTFGWLLDIPAFILEALFNIPWVGGLLRNLWNGILTLVWGALSFLDIIAGLLGIRPEKRMRIMIIVQQDEEGEPITGDGQILPPLQRAIDTFKSEANVRLIPVGPFQFSSAFQSVPRASTDYIYREQRPSDSDTLDVNCDSDLLVDDLGVVGSKFNIKLSWDLFFSGWRRLIGYGAPVGVFAVRSFKDGMHTGCSNGPLADWVVVIFAAGDNRTLAHELGHACTLVHPGDTRFWPLSELASKDPCNLMVPGKEGGVGFQLSTGQIVVLRASRHVTYF